MDKIWIELSKEVRAVCKGDLSELQSDEDWIRFALNFILKHDGFVVEDGDIKDEEQSEKFRQDGNRLFYYMTSPLTEDNCIAVLKLYNKSIAYAPRESEKLALAYANRSTILFQLHKYELCIQDIDRALALPCSDNVRVQLSIRMIESMKALKDLKIKGLIEEVSCSLKELCLDDTLREKFVRKLESLEIARYEREQEDLTELLCVHINYPNPEVLCATDAVTIVYNEEYGRHLVATRDIEVGEMFSVEEPYTLVLTFEQLHLCCSNCLELCWVGTPCDYCTCAMYCSEECKITHWKKCHNVECAILPVISKTKSNLADVFSCTLRLVIQAVREFASIKELRKEVNEVDNCKDPREKGFSKNGVFASDKYRSVLGLLTNTEKRTNEQRFLMSIDSCFILYYLATRTDLLGKQLAGLSAIANDDDAVFIGSLLFRHQNLICTNYHYICEDCDSGQVGKCALVVLTFASLMNHSCNPNTLELCKFNRSIRCAAYTIKKGEQLFDNYCSPYTVMPKAERQRIISDLYHFKCNCQACREDWSMICNSTSCNCCHTNVLW